MPRVFPAPSSATARLSIEQRVVLACAGQTIGGARPEEIGASCRSGSFDWDALTAQAVAHRVTPLVITQVMALAGDSVPDAVAGAWRCFLDEHHRAEAARRTVVRDVLDFFEARQIRVMLLKGEAYDRAMRRDPGLLEASDIDVLVDSAWTRFPSHDRTTLSAFTESGGVEFGFQRHHDVDMNRVLDIDYRGLWDRARTMDGRTHARIMSAEDMLLTACVGLCRRRYRLLKDMAPVGDMVAAAGVDWARLVATARGMAADRIVFTALTVVQSLLGCEVPATALRALEPRAWRRRVLRHLADMVIAHMFPERRSVKESRRSRLVGECLRVASYHRHHYWPEMQARLVNWQLRHLDAAGDNGRRNVVFSCARWLAPLEPHM